MKSATRLWLLAATLSLHLICYFSINRFNSRVPDSRLWDFSLPLDRQIPYLGWTAVIYYYGVPFMSLWALLVGWRLPSRTFVAAIQGYLGMIFIGALTQILLPARSPWPVSPVPFQGFMHSRVSYDPYVCLPSMHVAFSVLPACLSLHAFRSPWIRFASLVSALVITLSTLTLKEHYALDSLAGGILALGAYAYIRHREMATGFSTGLGLSRDNTQITRDDSPRPK